MSSVKKDGLEREKNKIQSGTLYLVATPIGNLSDISERAIKTLSEVDFIAAEDTRNTLKLLNLLGISKPMISYFEHNKRERGEIIVSRLKEGESCALVTDAGTPAISDPGEDIVALCAEHGVAVTSVPGPCALIDALTLSGLPTGRFTFEGFLPTSKNERKKRLDSIKNEEKTLIFYEAPHKLRTTLSDLLEVFGAQRRISLCRELTKLNEEVLRTTLGEAVEIYKEREPRGEYVLIMEGSDSSDRAVKNMESVEKMTPVEHVKYYMDAGMTKNEAIKAAAHDRGVKKNVVYQEILEKL